MRPIEKSEIIQALQSAMDQAIIDKRLSDAEYFRSIIERLNNPQLYINIRHIDGHRS